MATKTERADAQIGRRAWIAEALFWGALIALKLGALRLLAVMS